MDNSSIKQAKVYLNNMPKRFNLTTSFDEFKRNCERFFSLQEGEIENYHISYVDDDDDKIIISSNYDYSQALIFAQSESIKELKLYLEPRCNDISRAISQMTDAHVPFANDPVRSGYDFHDKELNLKFSDKIEEANKQEAELTLEELTEMKRKKELEELEKKRIELDNKVMEMCKEAEKRIQDERQSNNELNIGGVEQSDSIVEEEKEIENAIANDIDKLFDDPIAKLKEEEEKKELEEQARQCENDIRSETSETDFQPAFENELNYYAELERQKELEEQEELKIQEILVNAKKNREEKFMKTFLGNIRKLVNESKKKNSLRAIRDKRVIKSVFEQLKTLKKTEAEEDDKHENGIRPIKISDEKLKELELKEKELKAHLEALKQKDKEYETIEKRKTNILQNIRRKAMEEIKAKENMEKSKVEKLEYSSICIQDEPEKKEMEEPKEEPVNYPKFDVVNIIEGKKEVEKEPVNYPKFDVVNIIDEKEEKEKEPVKIPQIEFNMFKDEEKVEPKAKPVRKRLRKIKKSINEVFNYEGELDKQLQEKLEDLPEYIDEQVTTFKTKLVKQIKTKTAKLLDNYLKLTKEKQAQKESSIVHEDIRCNGCQVKPVIGNRFKCSVCEDFDFCEKCELQNYTTGNHKHCFIMIRHPNMAEFIRENHGSEYHLLASQLEANAIPDLSSECLTNDLNLHIINNKGSNEKQVTKQLTFKNNGKMNWPQLTILKCLNDKSTIYAKSEALPKIVKPGEEITVPVSLKYDHLSPGKYFSFFRLLNASNNEYFGAECEIHLTIEEKIENGNKNYDLPLIGKKNKPVITPEDRVKYGKLIKTMRDNYGMTSNEYTDDNILLALVSSQGNVEEALMGLLK
jgi:hypothetical protein